MTCWPCGGRGVRLVRAYPGQDVCVTCAACRGTGKTPPAKADPDYSIEPVVRKARRQCPHEADDLEQEIRLGHWLATQRPPPPGRRFSPAHARMKGKWAGVDYLRKWLGQSERRGRYYRAPTVPYVDDPCGGE